MALINPRYARLVVRVQLALVFVQEIEWHAFWLPASCGLALGKWISVFESDFG